MYAQNHLEQQLHAAAAQLRQHFGHIDYEALIILGSGLNAIADKLQESQTLSYAEVEGMCVSTAAGHVGQFVSGKLAGCNVFVMQGRLHGYEGYSAQEVAYPVWVAAHLDIPLLITSNAAGALNVNYAVGDFCLMKDQINLTGRNPLAAAEPAQIYDRFVSMFEAFDPALQTVAQEVAAKSNISLQTGVYAGLLGPSFETPAEIRMLQVLGADSVAMSVCEEVIAARAAGMKVIGVSLITNMGCGIEGANPNDLEVQDVGAARVDDFYALLEGVLSHVERERAMEGASFGTVSPR